MAYLPSDVLKKLRELAEQGSKGAQNTLKASGNDVPKQTKQPAQQQQQEQKQPELFNIMNQQTQQTQQTPEWVKQLEESNSKDKEHKDKKKDEFQSFIKTANEEASKRKEYDKAVADRIKGKSYFELHNSEQAEGKEVIDRIDKQSAKFAPNAKYKVNDIDASTLRFASDENVELWCVDNSQKGLRVSDSLNGTTFIGRDNLEGVNKDTQYVLYNKATGELYQYSTDKDTRDTVNRLAKAKDDLQETYYATQQSAANSVQQRDAALKALQETADKYNIDLTGDLTNEEYAIIQKHLDMYIKCEEQAKAAIRSGDTRLSVLQNRVDELQKYANGTGVMSVNDYLVQKSYIDKYADAQAVYKGDMRPTEFKEKYGVNISLDVLNNSAAQAELAQEALSQFNGTLIDTMGISNDIDYKARTLLTYDEVERNAIKKNAEDAASVYNMSDPKQINSLIDIYRKAYVSLCLDNKGDIGAKLQSLPQLYDDYKTLISNTLDTIRTPGSEDTIDTGLSGVLLAHMADAGDLFTGWFSAAMDARGFNGTYDIDHDPYNTMPNLTNRYTHISNSFADGELNNADYYYSKAMTYSSDGGFHNVKAFLNNWGLAMEAQLRGDLRSDVDITKIDNLVNGVNQTAQLKEHPIFTMLTNIGLSIIVDPTTYIGGIAKDFKGSAVSDDLVSKHSDTIINALKDSGFADNLIDEDSIKAIVRNECEKALELGNKNLDSTTFARIADDMLTPIAVDDMVKTARVDYTKVIIDSCKSAIADMSSDAATAKLWEDSAKIMKTGQKIEELDKVITAFQMGPIAAILPSFNVVKHGLDMLLDNKVVAGKMMYYWNHLNEFCYNATKYWDKGSSDLVEFNKLHNAFKATHTLDIIETAMKNGEDCTQYLDDFHKMSDNLRVEFAHGVIDRELSTLGKSVQDSIGTRELLLTKPSTIPDIDELAKVCTKHDYMTSDVLDNLVVQLTTGKTVHYGEYIDNLRAIAAQIDTPNANRSVRAGIDNYVNRMENLINIHNNRVIRNQCALMNACLEDGSAHAMDILRTLDLTKVAPELQVDMMNALAETDKINAVKTVIHKYEKACKTVTEATGFKYIPSSHAIKHPEVGYVNPLAYLKSVFASAGARPEGGWMSEMCKGGIEEFKDGDLVGKYYKFNESAETNLNAILNNKPLRDVMNDEELKQVCKDMGYTDFFETTASLERMDNAQFILYETLGATPEYHAVMDTIAGGYEELNKLAREYLRAPLTTDKSLVINKMVDYIINHTNTVQEVAGTGIKLTATDTYPIREAVLWLVDGLDNKTLEIIPRRESIYPELAALNEKLLADGYDFDIFGAGDLSSRVERALEDGAYTTCNSELGTILCGSKVDAYLELATGIEGYHANHMKGIMDIILKGEDSVGLRVILDADRTAQFVSQDMIKKCVSKGESIAEELNNYGKDLEILYNQLDDIVNLSSEDAELYRTIINNMCKNLTEPIDIRYLEYFNSVDFSDSKKALTAIIDVQNRLGLNLDTVHGLARVKKPDTADAFRQAVESKYVYKGKVHDKRLLKTDSETVQLLLKQKEFMNDFVPEIGTNKYRLQEELYNALGVTDGKTRLQNAKRTAMAADIESAYSEFNYEHGLEGKALHNLRSKQVEYLREAEEEMWNKNVQRVINWDKETLDHALLCTHSNAIVCDTEHYPELAKWLLAREQDGYVLTRTQVGGQSVTILSMDFNNCTDEYKNYLRNLEVANDNVHTFRCRSDAQAYDTANLDEELNRVYSRCTSKFTGTNFAQSAIGGRVNMDWHSQLQQLIPEHCRLDAGFTQMHNNAYMGNMLVTPQLAQATGAMQGHMLGSWYYSEVAALSNDEALGTLEGFLNAGGSTVESVMGKSYENAGAMHNEYKRIKAAGYHIIALDYADVADAGKTYKMRDVTELYNGKNYQLPNIPGKMVTNNYKQTVLANATQHYVVDNLTYKYLSGEIAANNRLMSYYTTPRLIHQALDVMDSYRSAIVTGLLYASNVKGTGVRNIIDSNIKAMAELGTDNAAAYTKNYLNAIDAKMAYVERMAEIYQETGKQGMTGINEYISKHFDDVNFNAREFMTDHAIFTMNEMDDDVAKEIQKLCNEKLLDNCTFNMNREVRDKVIDAFNKTRDAFWLDAKYSEPEVMQEYLYDRLKDALVDMHSVNSDEQISELSKLYDAWSKGPAEHWYTKMFDENNIVGRNLSAINKTTFDNAETRCRYAMMRTLIDNGESKVDAFNAVIKTQFDYGTSTGMVGTWDKIMPFAKYQFNNAVYWLDNTNYSSFTMANMTRLSRATQPMISAADSMKTAIAIEYMRRTNNESTTYELTNDPKNFFEESIGNVIENYKGASSQYSSGINVDNHHFIKIGNGMMDTIDWVGKVLKIGTEINNGEIPTVLKDTIFGPAKILPTAVPKIMNYILNPSDKAAYEELHKYLTSHYENGKYVQGHLQDVIGCVPVFGQLANLCLTSAKNVMANKELMSLVMCSDECQDNLLANIGANASALGFGILNSIIGTSKAKSRLGNKVFVPYTDDEGNRITWSKLTDEEKAGYTFLSGISNDVMWEINPSARYGLYGRLCEMGFDKATIKTLTNRWMCTNPAFMIDDNGNTYTDMAALETTVLDMLEQGYSVYEITYLLTATDKWYDLNTHKIINSQAEMQQQFMNEAFLLQYEMIPDYIKYQPDMYKEMMARYKALGMTTAEAWRAMRVDGEYIGVDGNLTKLTEEQRADYIQYLKNEYFEGQQDDGFLQWYNQLPEYIRYEKGAYSRTLAYLKQMFSDEEAKQMIMNGAYYTPDGKLINCSDLQRAPRFTNTAFQDEAGYWHKQGDFQVDGYWFHEGDNPYLGRGSFQNYWNELPDYLRYTKGAWSQTNKVLKEAGFDYNTRMQAMLDGAYAMQVDPNSEYFQQMLAKQNMVAVTKTIYVDKQVPLRECSNVNGQWVWNGPQSMKITELGNGQSMTEITKSLEFNAASMGLTKESKWKSYDAAMVTVKVPQTVTEVQQDAGQIMYRIVTDKDGKTWIIVPCPPYSRPRGGYYKKGYPRKFWKNYGGWHKKKRYQKDNFKKIYGSRTYNGKPMTINYSNVRTFSKVHFMEQQSTGYKYWAQWGDARITNHRNRNGRMQYPSTYRNPRSRARNMYKDLYCKYGASRMNQRQNIAGYSNASVTRLRRNEIANRTYNMRINGARI